MHYCSDVSLSCYFVNIQTYNVAFRIVAFIASYYGQLSAGIKIKKIKTEKIFQMHHKATSFIICKAKNHGYTNGQSDLYRRCSDSERIFD